MIPTFDLLIDAVKEWEGDWSHLIEKLEKCKLNFVERVRDVYLGRNEWIVPLLNHCDFHYKNVVFRKENGKIVDLSLVGSFVI